MTDANDNPSTSIEPSRFAAMHAYLEGFKEADAVVRYDGKPDVLASLIQQRGDHDFTRGVVACLVKSTKVKP